MVVPDTVRGKLWNHKGVPFFRELPQGLGDDWHEALHAFDKENGGATERTARSESVRARRDSGDDATIRRGDDSAESHQRDFAVYVCARAAWR